MKINNCWNLKSLQQHYVCELENGEYKIFCHLPIRVITESDLNPYKGHNPYICKGTVLPDYILSLFGLERITPKENINAPETAASRYRNKIVRIACNLTLAESAKVRAKYGDDTTAINARAKELLLKDVET